jgi:uncharacterized membrane protein YdbT with pleckstrin-like domain
MWEGLPSKIGDKNRKRCNRMAGGNNATVHVSGFLMMKEMPIVNSIHLQNRLFSQGLFQSRNPACSAIGELRRQSTTGTGASLIR